MRRPVLIFALAALLCAQARPATAERRPLHDAGHALLTLGEDAWDVVTAPTQWDRGSWTTFGWIVGVGGVLFAVDEDLSRMMVRNREEPILEQMDDLGTEFSELGLMSETLPYYAGALLIGYAADLPPVMRLGAQLIEATWVSGALRNASKLALGRSRPYEDRGAYDFEFNGGTSFPSGHAASVFSLAEVIRLRSQRWWVYGPVYTVAVSMGYRRISSRQHWASDVWIGAVSGIAAARFVVSRHEPGFDDDRAQLLPVPLPDGGAGLAVRFGL